jgi:predicted nucleotidyltransferase
MTEFGNRKVVLKALVGSHNYNLNTVTSDEDWKYFVAPTFEDLYNGTFYSNSKTSAEVDYTVHDIRQLGNLVWKANVNFLEVMFSKKVEFDAGLNFLFDRREEWASMNLPAFRNATYGMHLQKMNNLHKGTETTRHIVETLGYDTKEACHALRCLYVLEKYADTGSMEKALWFNKGKRHDTLLAVKRGEFTETEFKEVVNHWHVHVWGELSKAYNDTRAIPELNQELNTLMFQFVKSQMGLA